MSLKKYTLSKFPLYSNETPVFRRQRNQEYIAYGVNNDFPDYLSYLYNSSGIHGAIVQGKSTYIQGKGYQIKADWTGDKIKLQALLDNINSTQTANELSKKKVFEKTLYGGAAYLIEWGVNGIPKSIKLQPFNTIRTNEEKTEFYISRNWTEFMSTSSRYKKSRGKMPEDAEIIPAFDLTNKVGKQILYLIDENPASDIYPLPEYVSGATPIESDIEGNFFTLNNIKTGFAAGTMITFFNGNAENPEEEAEVEIAFKEKTSGTDNAGEILINFQNPNTQPPQIDPLRSNDLATQYESQGKEVINKILYSHRVSNGLLFGIKTPGELGGGRSEFDLAWEHFTNTYVKPKQQEEEEDFNYLLSLYGFQGSPVEIMPLEPVGLEFTVADVMSVLSLEEKRRLLLDKFSIEADKKVNEVQLAAEKEDFILNLFLNSGDPFDNYEVIAEAYTFSAVQTFAKSSEDELLAYLVKNRSASISGIATELKISTENVYKILDKLNRSNTLAVQYIQKGKEIIVETEIAQNPKEIKKVGLETKWYYTTRLEPKILPKTDKSEGSRKFCRDLITANNLYSREQIDAMQNVAHTQGFNEDVFKYKGGWLTIEGTNVHVPQCRHFWQNLIVRKKN
jgi:hypothetical protein